MYVKYFLILLFITIHNVVGKKSFTLVMDTTKSMEDEIYFFKVNIASVLNAIKSPDFFNYILIPFGDEVIDPPIISPTPEDLVDILQFLEASGGQGCPENSLGAIETALKVSLPNSYIYVFTDAEAKTHDRLESIKQLCQSSRTKVNIFKSDECNPSSLNDTERDNIYYEITRNCGGSVFLLSLRDLRDVFKYMKEISKVNWSDVNTNEEFTDRKQYTITIHTYTKELIVAVSGKYPTLQLSTNFALDSPHVEKIVATYSMLVVRIDVAQLGDFTADINCQGTGMVTFYKKNEVKFSYGFSPLQPNSLQETAPRPIPGVLNYVLISVPDDLSSELISVNIKTYDQNTYDERKMAHYELDKKRGLYLVQIHFEQRVAFKISITCRNTIDNQDLTGTTGILQPQQTLNVPQRFTPRARVVQPESTLIDFGTSFRSICNVYGYPTPDIWWENDFGEKIPSQSALLEMPSTYISYATIANMTRNVTITCKSKNYEGESEEPINLYVNRTFVFDIIQHPTDMTVNYATEARLYCEVNAYPDAEIIWYHNDTLINDSDNVNIVPGEHMLLIKNMTLDNTGDYKCVIKNEVDTKSYLASVYITGLEAPQIKIDDLEIVLKPGDWTEQQCTVLKGIPRPEVSWKYKLNNGDFDKLPEGVLANENSLKIASADKDHEGFYVCEAANLLGVDAQELSVKIQYAPKIKDGNETKVANEGDLVKLPCDVDAIPRAIVYWEKYLDDVIVPLDEHYRIDEGYDLRFSARMKDSAIYQCTAENVIGRTTRIVTLNVLVSPYIEALPWNNLTVHSGASVVLTCDVSYGNPVPSTKWQYMANNSDTVVLLRSMSAGKLNLVLKDVTRRQEGSYQCVSENEVGIDSVKVYLKVLT